MIASFPILDHAFGKRYDLPVPLYLFVLGGALVVFASFLLVLPRPVAQRSTPSGPDGAVRLGARRPGTSGATMAVLSLLVLAGLVGPDRVAALAPPAPAPASAPPLVSALPAGPGPGGGPSR